MAGPIWAERDVALEIVAAGLQFGQAGERAGDRTTTFRRSESIREAWMTTRRNFLKGAAGMAFCSCGLLDAARAQQPAQSRLPVMVDGKRVKTIDVHAHCLFHEAVDLMGEQAASAVPPVKRAKDMFTAVEERLRAMDAMAID